MSEVKIHANGRVTHQRDDGTATTEGTMLINSWSVDRVTERGAVIRVVFERKYGKPGHRDVSYAVVRGDSPHESFASTRREARARIGA